MRLCFVFMAYTSGRISSNIERVKKGRHATWDGAESGPIYFQLKRIPTSLPRLLREREGYAGFG